ncbi:MAG: hypothetical protein ABW161_18755 [Candidatus Thiodiazotropha sp.]
MKQHSLEASGFEKYRKKTRKEQFLDEMDEIIPWNEMCEAIAPYYPKPLKAGRKPIGLAPIFHALKRQNPDTSI